MGIPTAIAKPIGGRKLCDLGERTGTAVQFVGFAGIERAIVHAANSLARDLASEVEKRSSNVEWHRLFNAD